jgi:hypothetical protein
VGFIFLAVACAVAAQQRHTSRQNKRAAASANASAQAPIPSGATALPPVEKEQKIVQEIYAGGLKSEWQDWGWADRDVKGPGPAKFNFSKYAGWILAHKAQQGDFGALVFKLKAPAEFGEFLEVKLDSDGVSGFEPIKITKRNQVPLADGWVQVIVPMYELNPYGLEFSRVRMRANKSVAATPVFIDAVGLSGPSKTPAPTRTFPTRDAAMKLRCDAKTQPISPLIYGVAGHKAPEDLKATAYRLGGNGMSRFNWQLGDAWNTASDWYYRNVKHDWNWRTFIDTGVSRGAYVAITVPMLGWVAKDHNSYSFPVSSYGKQKDADPSHSDMGNGVAPDGKELKPPPPTRTSMPAPPEFIKKWVETIRKEDQARGKRGVQSYILDNEPALWNSTHRDVHPEPVTYDELLDRTIRYGSAVRAADPDAVIAGPAEWGWPGYFWSAKDSAAGFSSKPDRRAHGDVPLLDWYLTKLREHEKNTGVRILDVVDLHFYPQGKGLFQAGGGGNTDPDAIQRRFNATRSLWDPSYVDESWIKDTIRLIPRIKEVIAKNYPGRGFSIGEWNFGAEGHIGGALALAEALGRFAQGGVTSAYYWTFPKPGSPAYWAFRAFRNYDGKGASFLNNYVESTAPEGTSLFVSKNDAGTRYVAVALNFQRDTALKVKLETSACRALTAGKRFTYVGSPKGFEEAPLTPRGAVIEATLPPYSITVLDFQTAG